ncbi:PIH1 domain-containing protein, putative [Plasmodium vivax]|uniref:PIH1 N-terminal domain-containing protein n=3 Tax=Plasmodium vivax TaxID=5855 RepID=A5KEC5_PLAVS|nr:hypothetical protein, conserved [Plasmodium vivax]KMZ87272.1 hypothetical protein PVBG_05263 [Plasmodium vivax Brazil I]EDL42343.1 hypothetical protein, conserved [Plasmodium vivax]CAG9480749.1 unnamed protein product [Plasmodium vivax]CAI7719765.1 PIH1 domain-containing protein, putative [Plasmodium vivax]SCO66646.1 PIH1 domain-containing protein, putative [Plasmodium vivax]|eukprot:XP_001608367.1 hypothetical protein [Plasmodium vivax Sal-1]
MKDEGELRITYEEKDRLQKAFRQHEFRALFDDYFDEVSDEKYRKEKEDYLFTLYFKGELKESQILIEPIVAFCVKTKILYSNQTQQKMFLNICAHEGMHCISFEGEGRGRLSIPYSLSQMRPDKTGKGACCLTVDCCTNPSTIDTVRTHNEILNHLLENVCMNIEKNILKDREKVSRDFKISKRMACKGGKPFVLCINKEFLRPSVVLEVQKKLEGMRSKFERVGDTATPSNVEGLTLGVKVKTEVRARGDRPECVKKHQEEEKNHPKSAKKHHEEEKDPPECAEDGELESTTQPNESVKRSKECTKKTQIFVTYQGSINAASLWRQNEQPNVCISLPEKIKVSVCTKGFVRRENMLLQVGKKRVEVKFVNCDEDDVVADLPYPCRVEDYSCVVRRDKGKIEICLNLCEEFVRAYAKSLYEEYFSGREAELHEAEVHVAELDYIDDVMRSHEVEAKAVKAANEADAANLANLTNEADSADAADAEPPAGEEKAKEHTSSVGEESTHNVFPPFEEKLFDFSQSEGNMKRDLPPADASECTLERAEMDEKDNTAPFSEVGKNNGEGKQKEHILYTLGRGEDSLEGGGKTTPPDYAKIEFINDDAAVATNGVAPSSEQSSPPLACKHVGRKANKVGAEREKGEMLSCEEDPNGGQFLLNMQMYENMDMAGAFSCSLWAAYL